MPEAQIAAMAGSAFFIGWTKRSIFTDSADVYIQNDLSPLWSESNTYLEIVEHELGHAMGLRHIQANTLMYWEIAGDILTPTCDDAAQWFSIRGMPVMTEECPQGGTFTYEH